MAENFKTPLPPYYLKVSDTGEGGAGRDGVWKTHDLNERCDTAAPRLSCPGSDSHLVPKKPFA